MNEPLTLAYILWCAVWCLVGLVAANYTRIRWDVDWKSEHVAILAMLGPFSILTLFAAAACYRIMYGDWPWNK